MVASPFPLTISDAHVRKRGQTLLGPVSLTLKEGGLTMVMGPNGAGKTTLLRLLHGMEYPKGGTVEWNLPLDEIRHRQAFVFQSAKMLRRSVLDNIAYPLLIRGTARREARMRAKEWAERIDLTPALKREAQSLSGGERQKLALARALIAGPDVLFLDEPTTNLDGRSTREIEDLLKQALGAGTRIIMASHDIGQCRRLAQEVVFLNRGRIETHAPAEEFFVNPGTPAARAYLRGDLVE